MAVTVGIFNKEEEVLEAIRLLREAGVDKDEIRVVVGNREGAPILASNGDVHIEELYEIQETRELDGEDRIFPIGVAPSVTGYPVGNTLMGIGTASVIVAGYDSEDGLSSEEVLKDIGIPGEAAKKCGEAVESGSYLLVADADSEINASSLLKHAGASDIVH
ncbi:general stress protein [Cohnella silvisoli]|uniref:General stress protein n=1 Tax=Cohnella silvisoli TaxID=2873699 RepID=A0ABV1L2U4_9BACL|nr:general stress protein [Cohnella silvisoli]MCD9025978.1 general stress protein [Cohnella silvisoli]